MQTRIAIEILHAFISNIVFKSIIKVFISFKMLWIPQIIQVDISFLFLIKNFRLPNRRNNQRHLLTWLLIPSYICWILHDKWKWCFHNALVFFLVRLILTYCDKYWRIQWLLLNRISDHSLSFWKSFLSLVFMVI